MLQFTLYEVATGIIISSGRCPDETCLPDKTESQDFLFDLVGDPETEKVEDGTLIPYIPFKENDQIQSEIIRERTRRLSLGFDYDFGDVRGIHHIGTTESDMAGWGEVTQLADVLEKLDNGSTEIFITTDTGPVSILASEWKLILLAAGQFRQPIWKQSFIIGMMNPLPQNVADDSLWIPMED